MTQRPSSPPLVKGIDGIVSRYPNKVNYSTLNGKRIETGKQPEIEIRRKYRISKNMANDVKQDGNSGKNKSLIKPGNINEFKLMNYVELDKEDSSVTRKIHESTGEAAEEKEKEKVKTQIVGMSLVNASQKNMQKNLPIY